MEGDLVIAVRADLFEVAIIRFERIDAKLVARLFKQEVPGALDVLGSERLAVVPFDALAQRKGLITGNAALAEKQGGILKTEMPDSPPSMSILEEVTLLTRLTMMGVFNNLVMFDQHVKQVSLQSIVADLASSWTWNEDGTASSNVPVATRSRKDHIIA